MKSAFFTLTILFTLLLPNISLGLAIPQTPFVPSTHHQQREVKEFSQRLNKLINAYNRKKADAVRVLYEGVKADIRREVAQIRARTVQASKVSPNDPAFATMSLSIDQLKARTKRMQFIKDFVGQTPFPSASQEREEGKALIALLKEFESLMKEELEADKKAK